MMLLLYLSLSAFAQDSEITVGNDDYIRSKIKTLSEGSDFSYDELEGFFRNNPTYNTKCFTDKNKQSVYSSDDLNTFSSYLPFPTDYQTQFNLQPDSLGFDLILDQTPFETESDLIKELSGSLGCQMTETGCMGLIFSAEEKLEVAADSESEPLTVNTDIAYFIESKKRLFSTLSISMSITKYGGLLGNVKKTAIVAHDFLCVHSFKNEVKDL